MIIETEKTYTCKCEICNRIYKVGPDTWWKNCFLCSSQCCAIRREEFSEGKNSNNQWVFQSNS